MIKSSQKEESHIHTQNHTHTCTSTIHTAYMHIPAHSFQHFSTFISFNLNSHVGMRVSIRKKIIGLHVCIYSNIALAVTMTVRIAYKYYVARK